MQITTSKGQSLLDIALQECGAFEAAFDLADRLGIAISDTLEPGTVLEIAPEDIRQKQAVTTLKMAGAKPATDITAADIAEVPYGGIGFMKIEIDFIVS